MFHTAKNRILSAALLCISASVFAQGLPADPTFEVRPIITPGVLEKKSSTALQSLGIAAEQGDAKAQYQLGMSYLNGLNTKKDIEKAAQWFAMAASQGDDRAQVRLGYLTEFGRGVQLDINRSTQLYKMSSEQGNTEAHARYARALELGQGVQKDPIKAFALYRLANRAGEQLGEKGVERMNKILTSEQKSRARDLENKIRKEMPTRY